MSCQINVVPPTEFDFYTHLLNSSDLFECAGPLLSLCIYGEQLEELTSALDCVKFTSFLDTNLAYAVGDKPVYEICYRHWLELAKVLMSIGSSRGNAGWVELGYALLVETSTAVGFDYRLIVNYLTSLNRMKSIGNLFREG